MTKKILIPGKERNKIKDKPSKVNYGGLPDLTEVEQKYVSGRQRGMTRVDALRGAVDNIEEWTTESLYAYASKLDSSLKVRLWINAVNDHKVSAAALTKEAHLSRLEELSIQAQATGNFGAAVQAEQLRGKVQGYHIDRVEDVTRPQSTQEFLDGLYRDWGSNGIPIIQQIAREMDVEWSPPVGAQNGTRPN